MLGPEDGLRIPVFLDAFVHVISGNYGQGVRYFRAPASLLHSVFQSTTSVLPQSSYLHQLSTMQRSFTILIALIFALHAAASVVPLAAVYEKRQSGLQYPAACNSTCIGLSDIIANCAGQPNSCVCTSTAERDLVKCLECTVQSAGPDNQAANLQEGQSVVANFLTTCETLSVSLPATTLTSFTSFPSASAASVTSNVTSTPTAANTAQVTAGGFSGGTTSTGAPASTGKSSGQLKRGEIGIHSLRFYGIAGLAMMLASVFVLVA